MRLSYNSLLPIFLVWGGVCLSQVYSAPITHDDDAASGSDVQLAKLEQPDETSPLEGKVAGTVTRISEKPTEIDIYVLPSASATKGDQNIPSDFDDGEMFKYWFDMYLEFLKLLWSAAQELGSVLGSLITILVQQILPFALFLAACAGTIFLVFALVSLVMVCLASVVSDGGSPTERTR
ncbi:hypothetical protein BGX38DRAFT_1235001, partial [Terfezia claveryi]